MSQVSSSVDWLPKLTETDGPLYLAFVQALESDVQSGVLKPGTRLLPQRDMASQLRLSVGTISRAYAEAEARGLISGEVGRGTFVQRRRLPADTKPSAPSTLNLALNVPPATGEDELIAAVLSEILADGALNPLLGYLPHQGLASHRDIVARWLTTFGVNAESPCRSMIPLLRSVVSENAVIAMGTSCMLSERFCAVTTISSSAPGTPP